MAPVLPIPQRTCGGCTMCCKIMEIEELKKPPFLWCDHCKIGQGCKIYPTKPPSCTSFLCQWLADESFGPEWRPDVSKIVMFGDEGGRRLIFDCDPTAPTAWQDRRYLPTIMEYGAMADSVGQIILVCVGRQMYFVGKNGIVDLGKTRHTHAIGRKWAPGLGSTDVSAVPLAKAIVPSSSSGSSSRATS